MSQEITADRIKALRERTGVAMGKCKEALVAAGGDMEKAIDHLRKAGMAAGVKKEGRETKEGMIVAVQDAHALVLLEANVETDFVAQNERFQQFLQDVAAQALASRPKSVEELLHQPYRKDPSITLEQYRNLVIQALGENIQVRRLEVLLKGKDTSFGIYSHMGGKLVVVVELQGDGSQEEVAKKVSMHVAAKDPSFVHSGQVPSDILAREEEIARSQVVGKPANIIDKIVAGKMQAFFDETCLVSQKFIMDETQTVAAFVEQQGKKGGKSLRVHAFWRWKVGQ